MRPWLRWLPALAWCAAIYWFSASPVFVASSTREVFGLFNILVRKSAHFAAFGTLALLFYWALVQYRYRWIGAWMLATLYAASDEWHQSFVPGRGAGVDDVLLDSLGALVMLVVLGLWLRWRQGKMKPEG